VPQHVFLKVLTKQETVNLNQASIVGDTGLPNLAGGMQIHSGFKERLLDSASLAETEGKPKEGKGKPKEDKPKQNLKQKIPLRPRNSQFKGILDIAQNLRDVGSTVPLVVLTNTDELMTDEVKAENPNLQLIWLNETDFIQRDCKIGAGHEMHFQKLAIWRLTQFDKLLWLDTDIAFAKNVDYVFDNRKFKLNNGNRIYGQIDDYQCDGREWSPTSGGVCSGMLLIKPSTTHFTGLMAHQARMKQCWGDQSIIGSYFSSRGREARQFQRYTINFARCSKMGWMDAVHFSGSPNAKRVGDEDRRIGDGQIINRTEVALKAAIKEAAEEKKQALDEKKAKAQKERTSKRYAKKDTKEAKKAKDEEAKK